MKDQGPETTDLLSIALPNGLVIYPTGTPLAIDVPAGSVVTFPSWWSCLDGLVALDRLGIAWFHWIGPSQAEVVG